MLELNKNNNRNNNNNNENNLEVFNLDNENLNPALCNESTPTSSNKNNKSIIMSNQAVAIPG